MAAFKLALVLRIIAAVAVAIVREVLDLDESDGPIHLRPAHNVPPTAPQANA